MFIQACLIVEGKAIIAYLFDPTEGNKSTCNTK